MLTLTFLRDVVDHAIDTDEIPSGSVDARMIVNLAGTQLMNMRQWRWADRVSTRLDVVQDQEWIDLPAGTLRVVAIQRCTYEHAIEFVPVEVLETMRKNANQVLPSRRHFAALEYVEPSGGGEVTMRIGIYPPPSTSQVGAIYATIQKGWTTLEDEQDEANMPAFMHPLFLEVVRETARGWYEEDNLTLDMRMLQLSRGILFAQAAQTDGMVQPNHGPIRNSATEMAQTRVDTRFGTGPQELPT